MRTLLCVFLGLIAFAQLAHAGDDNPKSKQTRWRIPANAAVTAIGIDLKWKFGEHPGGLLTLQAGLGEHHSYEQAWAYYANIFGMETDYNADNKQQEMIVDGDKRSLMEHDRDHMFKAGRWARMYGKFGNYKTSVSLYDDPWIGKEAGKGVSCVREYLFLIQNEAQLRRTMRCTRRTAWRVYKWKPHWPSSVMAAVELKRRRFYCCAGFGLVARFRREGGWLPCQLSGHA